MRDIFRKFLKSFILFNIKLVKSSIKKDQNRLDNYIWDYEKYFWSIWNQYYFCANCWQITDLEK